MIKMHRKKGFTLIELIIVVTVIALLAAAIFVAIDPATRVGNARDARRYSDVTAVLNAVLTYTIDAGGLPTAVANMTPGAYFIVDTGSDAATSGAAATEEKLCNELDSATLGRSAINFHTALVDKYLGTMPIDPQQTTGTSTSYYALKSANNRITIGACTHYQTGSLEVLR